MKKISKKFLAILLCAWNLYLPNQINEDDEIQVNHSIVDEMSPILDEVKDDEDKKDGVKNVIYFIPTIIYSAFKAIISLITKVFVLNPIMILIFILLLLAALLFIYKKYWGIILGIIAGCLIIQSSIEVMNEWILGLIIILIHLGLGFVVYRKQKELKNKIIRKVKVAGKEYEI